MNADEIERIPQELKVRPQWVAWRTELRNGKSTKLPINPHTNRLAATDNPTTWGTFESALQAFRERTGLSGIGYVFIREDEYTGVDLDECRNPETGAVEAWAQDIVDRMASYTEVSPSGSGLHIIVKGALPEGRRRRGQIEMYDRTRFFTMSGKHVAGTPVTIIDRDGELRAWHAELFGVSRNGDRAAQHTGTPTNRDDDELLERARNAPNGDKFDQLYRGQGSAHTSPSEADLALCAMLAFWTGGDTVQMDRLFRRSGLHRDKWDQRHYSDGRTYGQVTIEKAIQGTREFYNGGDRLFHREQGGVKDTPSCGNPWPVLDKEAAYHGVIGEFVKAVTPYSEADPVAILLHTLIGAGCLIGPGPHALVEYTRHYARINVLFIGRTSGGRKGTAWSTPRYLLSNVDGQWAAKRVKSGLSSGEGLIFQVRDPQYEKVPIREGGKRRGEILGYEDVMTDPGEDDKRLLIIESEFATTLKVMEREGNTLSPVIRDAWDHGNLSPLTKKDRMAATGAHVCIVGHITQDELLRSLTATERVNGFANRHLFALSKRSKFLPAGKGAPVSVLEPYFTRFFRTLECARTRGALARDPDAEELWATVYPKLEEEIPGLTGAILARGAAQVLRLSLIYALLDEDEVSHSDTAIRVPHLLAALAVWDYCKASVFHIFGDAVGDPVADRLLRAIKTGPQTETDLHEVLGRHDGGRKDQALDLLIRLNRVHPVKVPTQGRPIREWHYRMVEDCALCGKRV